MNGLGVKGHGCVGGVEVKGCGCVGGLGGVKSWYLPVESSFATSHAGFACLSVVGVWFGLADKHKPLCLAIELVFI